MKRQSTVRPDSLAERAYHLLEEKLVTLALPPGSMLSAGELIEMTGFGRTPVREAIQRLAQQNFFDIVPRRGLQVTMDLMEKMVRMESMVRTASRASLVRRVEMASPDRVAGISTAMAWPIFPARTPTVTALSTCLIAGERPARKVNPVRTEPMEQPGRRTLRKISRMIRHKPAAGNCAARVVRAPWRCCACCR